MRRLSLLLLVTGCATGAGYRHDAINLDGMRAEATAQGLTLEDPLKMDDSMREAALLVGRWGTELERARRLNLWLRARDSGLGFTYDGSHSRTAREAFHARSGDCLSFAFLYVALARHIGVGMNFVRYREARTYDERNGQFTMMSHVAVLFTGYQANVLVELTGEPPSTSVSDYEPIGDDEAAALLMSNHAMEAFARGDREGPLKTMQFLVTRTPNLPEVHANLSAVLLREGRAAAALPIVQAALQRFPTYAPLYVNGAVAARGIGDDVLSGQYAEKAREAYNLDPFLPFVKGVWLYEKRHYAAAEQLIRRARGLQPNSALFAAWLARVQLKSGQYDEALRSLEDAAALNPQHPLVIEIREKEMTAVHPAGGGGAPAS